jgi:hypothetical protein
LLLPASPFGLRTNTFDLHARQTYFGIVLTGPKIKGLTIGAQFLAYIAKDNLVADSYGLLPFLAFGELRNEKWRFAAGLNLDVFNPLYPSVIPISILYGSGNTGEYRGQVRLERFFTPADDLAWTIQFAIGEPVGSVVTDNRTLLEDNGWPNFELRLAVGSGEVKKRAGGRQLRSLELGVSGLIGQLRTTGIILSPTEPESLARRVVTVQGLGLDAQLAFTDRFGLAGEFYVGDGLGEYGGGILQSFNTITFDVIPSSGAWGEAYLYFTDRLHVHAGYGLDDPDDQDVALIQIPHNQTAFATLYWELSKILQLGVEVEYRKTDFFQPLLSADGLIFMSQMLWRF